MSPNVPERAATAELIDVFVHARVAGLTCRIPTGRLTVAVGPPDRVSLFIALLAGQVRPDRGAFRIVGVTLDGVPDVRLRRLLGVVVAEPDLVAHLTVRENVSLSVQMAKGAGQSRAVNRLLDILSLTDAAERYPAELTIGQRRLVRLAQTLSYDPDLIVVAPREPTVDVHGEQAVFACLQQLTRLEGRTVASGVPAGVPRSDLGNAHVVDLDEVGAAWTS